ncbi:VIT domain-containing protein [Actinomadura verrucosospora]|uniref:Vault protein inter-alpha-trypsin domain-containing protein n=1 Tax=Actinomadura verrucosospora TaxID=46165 RepID=A0A7D3ZN38_ACTVE|nr:VIT domain-containing protein [Actinomadura verrucosospora]QKG22863.1 Vault protein inter-alpha-trypsin domain-containing protein [Actinomadura verrucosospora]
MTVRILPLPQTDEPTAPEGGLGALSTDRGNLPLDSVDVRASITGLAAGVEVVQGFRNPFDVPLEATYIFPLPDRAAVTALRMEADDRVVEGTLKERGQARQDYSAAIAAGQRAALAEEDRPDVFTMQVGNILPGERVTISLALTQPLPHESSSTATFRFPLVVAPRYIPGTPLDGEGAGGGAAEDTDAVPDASRISPPVLLPGFPNPVRLAISAEIDPSGLPLTEIQSALHVVTEESDAGRTTVRLRPGERLDRDFVLRLGFAPQESAALSLVPDESGDEGTFSLTVLPSGDARPRPRDVVLILDRSGSMHGWKMVAARRAAARIVDTLRDEDRFAVLSFDSVVERPRDLGSGLVPGTDRNRFRAVEHLAALDARGGTEMLAPLDEACRLVAGSEHDRVVVLITDGQVGNEDQLLAHLAPRLQGVRVHTVGIDRAVNAGFLNRLAAIGQGRCELVESEDRLDAAMDQIHHRIGAPVATDLSLQAEGLEIVPDSVAPARLGALFPGVPLVIAGRFRGEPAGSVTVHGTASDGTAWRQRASGTVARNPAATAIWARAHLRDLEDRYTVGGPSDLEQRIVEASLRFGVLCRFTAFVAVDSRVVTDAAAPHQVVQPVEMPSGWAAPATAYGAANPLMAAPLEQTEGSMPPRPPAPSAPSGPPAPSAPSGPPAPSAPSGPPPRPALSAQPPAPAGGSPARSRRRGFTAPADDIDVPDFLGTGAPSPAPDLSVLKRELAERLEAMRGTPDDLARRVSCLRQDVLPVLMSVIERMRPLVAPGADPLPALEALRDDLIRISAGSEAQQVGELWSRTLRVLGDFTGEGTESRARRPFWKRSR